MILESIACENFRNIENENISFDKEINLLYGKNAAGKTNVLEALYFFASGKSFRVQKESELIRHNMPSAKLRLAFLNESERSCKMDVSVFRPKESDKKCRKLMRYNGIEIKKASEFLGIFRAVLFTPDHLNLIKGAPDERRKFIDIAISQLSPKYITLLNEYTRVLTQRNAFLKAAQSRGFDETYFEVINEKLSGTAAQITKQRSGFCERLSKISEGIYSELSDERERLFIKYAPNVRCNSDDVSELKEKYFKLFCEARESDLRFGITHNGAHRDDLKIYLSKNETDDEDYIAKSFASQGQIRSGVLTLKLSEGEIIKQKSGEYPLFLLDDLFGELDAARRAFLLKALSKRQVIITSCDKQSFEGAESVKTIYVENGSYST